MPADLPYLHHLEEFPELIEIVASERGIIPQLVEKDYWIMHCLYKLSSLGFSFELKGGTSLSKGFGVKYHQRKKTRFRTNDILKIAENDAFLIADPAAKKEYEQAFQSTELLYYGKQPTFSKILAKIQASIDKL